MAAAIKNATGVESDLIPGNGGVFDVRLDGERIYCKLQTGQFPTDAEILAKLPVN